MRYGLIGEKLGHSFSKELHNRMNNDEYELKEIPKDEIDAWLDAADFEGVNVTIPYKEVAFRHCIPDENAKAIGCVNTLVKRDGKLYGYNTDIDGFLFMVKRAGISIKDKKVVIFGNGGTAKTAAYAAHIECAKEIKIVSRKAGSPDSFWSNYSEVSVISYDDAEEYRDAQVVFNTTPVGMFPNMEAQVVDLDMFDKLEGVVDVIYNPARTSLMMEAKRRGIAVTGGLPMLVVQAQFAEKIWDIDTVDADNVDIEGIVKTLENRSKNIVLIGMPGCGKTTTGKALSKRLGRELFDTDEEFTKMHGISPAQSIVEEGEAVMREKESQVAMEMSKKTGVIIATGGGLPIAEANRKALRHNGMVVFLERDLDKLATNGRPLSVGDGRVEKLYAERYDKYMDMADVVIKTGNSVKAVVDEIVKLFEG